MSLSHRWVLGMLLLPQLAVAAVGKVAVLDGSASRAPKEGAAVALKADDAIELGDTVQVKKGNLKLVLNDESVIMLGDGAKLQIDEASFAGQERQGFSARLLLGKFWAKVSKAVGGAKFEVTTERAVAGVRGTIFRIDADTLLNATKKGGKGRKATVVRVTEGKVGVKPTHQLAVASAAQASATAKKTAGPAPKGERKEIPPPFHEVTADEWEKKFEELQNDRQIAVGVDLWELADYDAMAKSDPFAKWVDAHQK